MDGLRRILEKLAKGGISLDEAEKQLRLLAIEEIGEMAKMDVSRHLRKKTPEVILAEGKSPKSLFDMAKRVVEVESQVIVSRLDDEKVEGLRRLADEGFTVELTEQAKMAVVRKRGFAVERTGGKIGILTAGTSDVPVAEEARVVAEAMGCDVLSCYDVGVAGIHRLFPSLKEMVQGDVDVVVVVAGREGALPSVVAGMVSVPVIAVPTSVGYGFGEKGVSALMAMLQACSLGLAVVNIDGGVAAGAVAALIANHAAGRRSKP